MKKYLMLVIAVIAISCTAKAQFSVGAGLVYGFDLKDLGLQVRGMYDVNDTWRGSADFTTYFIGGDGVSFSTINLNPHYKFQSGGNINTYGIAGLNISIASVKIFGERVSNSDIGLNIGAGAEYSISDTISALGEAKFVIGDASQLVIGAGAIFKF